MLIFQNPRVHRGYSSRLTLTALLGVLTALLSLLAAAAPSSAQEEQSPAQGWARVAHLSPDTKTVDVALTAVAGGQTLFDLQDVAYGDVSDYWRLPVGTYVVEMTPSGSPSDAPPAISELISVKKGQPVTLAVLGTNAELTTKVIEDDLTPPADGEARVRVLQASTVANSVDIRTVTGAAVASGVAEGEVTGYATIAEGPWDLELVGGSLTSAATVDLESGSISTLLILDNASGGLTIKAISDSTSVSDTPVGGTNTGAAPAGTVSDADGSGVIAPLSMFSLLGAVALTALVTARIGRRRSAPAAALRR